MAKTSLLTLSLGLLILLHGCLASRQQGTFQENECQLDRIDAIEPENRIEYEAGRVEIWNPNHEQFQCAGVAVVRHTIEQNGLLLPQFSNAPQLVYIVQGEGLTGVLIPGCPETYESPQRGFGGQGQSGRFQDRHQKVRRFRQGDVLAIPAGVAHWCYNEGNTPVVAVALFDISNSNNQLDLYPRKFHLAGNPQDEFQQSFRGSGYRGRGEGQSQRSCNNIFCGFSTQTLSEAFNVDERLARQLRNENDFRGAIVRVKGDELRVIRPPRMQDEEREYESERRYESERGRGRWNSEESTENENGLEETICTMRLRENIGHPSRSDVYTQSAGRIRTLNSLNLPVLKWLQLSAERGTLHNNGLMVPHWNLNAHSIVYSIRGSAHVQVVDNFGRDVFNGEVREGQVFVVPQNFAVMKRARGQRYDWISFKTNDNAMISPLAGRTSVLRGMPEEVLANAFMISREDARRLKFNNQQTTLIRGERSQRDTVVADA